MGGSESERESFNRCPQRHFVSNPSCLSSKVWLRLHRGHVTVKDIVEALCSVGQLRYYREDPIFDAYACFDTAAGRLTAVTTDEFARAAATANRRTAGTADGIERSDGPGVTVFTGTTRETSTRFPRRIYFQITRNCNLRCPYCFLKSRPGLPHVPAEAVLPMAAFLGHSGLMEVRLTGGEPTTHPDFFAILDEFRARDVYVSVATNGLLSQQVLDGLAERQNLWLICSVDGNRETHNRYRPDLFDRIMGNLRYLKQKSPAIRLRLTAVLTRRNKDQIRDLAEIARAVDAESVTVIPLRPQVRDPSVKDEMVTAAEFRRVLEAMVEASEQLGVRMTTTLATDFESRIHPDPIVRKRGASAAGREATNLDYDVGRGTFLVYGCSYSPAPDLDSPAAIRRPFLAGEFPADRPEELLRVWRDDAAWAIYRDNSFKSADCQQCGYYTRLQCVGSCPIQNVDYESIDVDADVVEQLRTQLSQTAGWYCYKRLAECGGS